MKITTKITLDLQRPNFATEVEVMQDDGETRILKIALASGGTAWDIPKGVSPVVVFRRPNGTKGMYDKLADGSPAVTTEGSTVTVVLSRQMLAIPGLVQASLQFEDAQLNQLTTFPFRVNVQANPYGGAQSVQDVVRLQWLETKLDECLKKAAESGAFDGKPGKTPVKGLDYFTQEEIEQFQHTVYDRVHDEISSAIDMVTQAASGANSAAKNAGQAAETAMEAGEAANTSAGLADAAVTELKRRVEAGEFDGKTPVKGVDYWTEAEVQAAEDAVYQRVDGKVSPVVEQAKTAADQAVATANEAKKAAGTADKKVEALREVVSKFHNNIVETARGERIALDDSGEAPLASMKLFGRTEQNGAPTADSPIPLVSLGDDGDIGVGVTGKNLFDINSLSSTSKVNASVSGDSVTFTATTSEWYATIDTSVAVSKNTEYVFSTDAKSSGTHPWRRILILDSAGNALSNIMTIQEDGRISGRFTTKSDETVVVRFGVSYDRGYQSVTYSDIQLEVGTSETPYEPYGGSITIPTPNGLLGIKVDSGGNYTDATGQQWLCDEVDLERGVYVKRVGKKTFTTVEGSVTNQSGETKYQASFGAADGMASGNWQTGLCNMFIAGSSKFDGVIRFGANDNGVYVYTNNDAFASKTTADAFLTKTPMTVRYILKNPVETPLSTELIAAYRALHTNYPNTNILNDEGAEMEVAYIADTKRYIDKKFDQLAKAMLR